MYNITKIAKKHGIYLKATETYQDPSGHYSWETRVFFKDQMVASLKAAGWGGRIECSNFNHAMVPLISSMYQEMTTFVMNPQTEFDVQVKNIATAPDSETQLREIVYMLITEHLRISDLKRKAEHSILLIDPSDPFKTAIIKHEPTAENMQEAKNKFPYLKIINEELESL